MAKNFGKDTTCIVLYCFSFGRLNECLVPRFSEIVLFECRDLKIRNYGSMFSSVDYLKLLSGKNEESSTTHDHGQGIQLLSSSNKLFRWLFTN